MPMLFAYLNGSIKSDNVKATYNGSKWTLAGTHKYSPKYQYFAYYPYRSAGLGHVTGTVASGTTAATFFANGISSFSVQTNQSSAANINASDLQVGKATISRTTAGDLTFSMSHSMGLASITLGSKSISSITPVTTTTTYTATNLNSTGYGYNATYGKWTAKETKNETVTTTVTASSTFSGNTPYKKSSTLYGFIMKPATATSFAGTGADSWSLSTRAASGAVAKSTVQSSRTSVTNAAQTRTATANYTVQVGDVVYTDGSISRPTTTYSGKTKMAMVVYINNYAAWAMALKNDNLTNGYSSNSFQNIATYTGNKYSTAAEVQASVTDKSGVTYKVSLPSGYYYTTWELRVSRNLWKNFITAFGGTWTGSNASPTFNATNLCNAMTAAGGESMNNDYWLYEVYISANSTSTGTTYYFDRCYAINPAQNKQNYHQLATDEHVRCVYQMTRVPYSEK